jgi:Tol biopolymer transport system component
MFDTVQTVVQTLSQADPFFLVVIRFVGGIMVGLVVAVLFISAGFVLAQCCRGDRGGGKPAAALSLVALLAGGIGVASAQEARPQESIPEVEPRFERLFGTDSLRMAAGVGGFNDMRTPSLSPDGRWVVFAALEDAERVNLWLAPVDGGKMVRLTRGEFFDDEPRWFGSGNAIAFLSTRPGNAGEEQGSGLGTYVMRMPISPENGLPAGPPRQVSLEDTHVMAISPDDQWIAYATRESYATTDRSSSLKVLPSTGGIPRTVISPPGYIFQIQWGAEGRFLYYLHWPGIEGEDLGVMRIPVEGGTPAELSTWDSMVRLSPDARRLFRPVPSEGEEGKSYEMSTVEGDPLARIHLPKALDLMGFTDAPGQFLAVRVDVANPLRVLPVAGGPVRRLNEAWGYDMPLDWTPDSREVLFKTSLNGRPILMLAPLDGSPMRQVPLPGSPVEGWPILSGDGDHILFFTDPEDGPREAWVYNIRSDSARKLDEGPQPPGYSFWGRWGIRGGGGTFMRDGTAFLYGIHRNDRYELMAADPEGPPRLLWSFPTEGLAGPLEGDPPEVAVHGTRIAFAQNKGAEASLYLAQVGENQARLLLTVPGLLGPRGRGPSTWSPDGRKLAMTYVPPAPANSGVLVVEVSETGEVVGEPLMLEGGEIGQWMPDSQHFLGGGNWSGEDRWGAGVWLISLDPDEEPILVSAGLQESIWYFRLSPDGRYITFEGEVPRGSSVWRVDLGDIFPGSGR